MKVTRKYPIVVVKEKKEYWAYIPDIPGIYGWGKSAKTAKDDIRDAASFYVEDCLAEGDKVPSALVLRRAHAHREKRPCNHTSAHGNSPP